MCSQVRIVTFNVRLWTDVCWQDQFESAWAVIQELNPDILILQEATLGVYKERVEGKLRALGYVLPESWERDQAYSFVAGPYHLTNIIAARMPGRSSIGGFVNDAPNLGYVRYECTLDGQNTIVIYGTHMDAFDASELTRAREMEQLLAMAHRDKQAGKQVIIAGDLNSVDIAGATGTNKYDVPVVDLLSAQYARFRTRQSDGTVSPHGSVPQLVTTLWRTAQFTDSFELAHLARPYWSSWWGARTDYVLFSDNFTQKIVGCSVYYTAVSDHLPVIVDIAL